MYLLAKSKATGISAREMLIFESLPDALEYLHARFEEFHKVAVTKVKKNPISSFYSSRAQIDFLQWLRSGHCYFRLYHGKIGEPLKNIRMTTIARELEND